MLVIGVPKKAAVFKFIYVVEITSGEEVSNLPVPFKFLLHLLQHATF
jgi:hypothetical protein